MTSITVGIIGYGYVGKAVYKYFENKYKTIWYDPYLEGSVSKNEINQCYLGVICVPTPSLNDGTCDVSAVEEVVDWLTTDIILIKSTVKIGTTSKLKQKTGKKKKKKNMFSPEYIGESDYDVGYFNFNKDMNNHNFLHSEKSK